MCNVSVFNSKINLYYLRSLLHLIQLQSIFTYCTHLTVKPVWFNSTNNCLYELELNTPNSSKSGLKYLFSSKPSCCIFQPADRCWLRYSFTGQNIVFFMLFHHFPFILHMFCKCLLHFVKYSWVCVLSLYDCLFAPLFIYVHYLFVCQFTLVCNIVNLIKCIFCE